MTEPLQIKALDVDTLCREDPIYIYGAGDFGMKVYGILVSLGSVPEGFVDSHKSGAMCGREVMNLQQYLGHHSEKNQIILASRFEQEIAASLCAQGIHEFVSAFDLIVSKTNQFQLRATLESLLLFLREQDRLEDADAALIDQVLAFAFAHGVLSRKENYSEITIHTAASLQVAQHARLCLRASCKRGIRGNRHIRLGYLDRTLQRDAAWCACLTKPKARRP